VSATLDRVWRESAASMRATLARRLGDLDLAEEALGDAVARAAAVWPQEGTPDNPSGWLVTTAWHRALDLIRREHTGREKLASLARQPAPAGNEDDRLALIFACCHPALSEPLQIALTLNAVSGLTSEEIAAAFLIPPATMAQRLVRAKHYLRRNGVRFAEPELEALPQRLRAALAVVYAVFNEGYLGRTHMRTDLSREAGDLAAQLVELMPAEAEVAGLAALIELHQARRGQRFDEQGRLVLLEEQDRAQWDHALIAAATARLDRALARGRPGPYQTQAAIAALHATAASVEATDWPQVRALHDIWYAQTGNPVVLLNRAIATWRAVDAATALDEVEALGERLGAYRLFHATRGELLRVLGRHGEARSAVRRALALATNAAERDLLQRRLEA
jgi:predicted RNA polymerase sigma factor